MKSLDAILIKPVLTEKMLQMQEEAQKYGFQVAPQANKIEIKKAIEGKFGVLVDKVHTVNVKGKMKRMNTRRGLTRGKRSDWKKAVVTLKEGYTIDLFQEQ
ncbi:50S ribosomal protein L23 [candidate division KSB1 bacterium]|nr:50S ribosomal protein L23 [candidate division KSB1 bacterium]MCH7753569.1 50S ribosomal protein L23 [candidate division KSB1 bacterium]MCH8871284.1 50S ribosomal protein L23 [candidate division KSB1 bacterium]MCH8953707.1 50S ribosomal protein L23 [candidate division KSB1 bacterium]